MPALKPREFRIATQIQAELRTGTGWINVTIGNISSRGVMLQCQYPPKRGTFVELRCRNTCIVARVVWSAHARCGLRTQNRIDRRALVGRSPCRAVAAGSAPTSDARAVQQGNVLRVLYDASRASGQRSEWLAIVGMGVLATAMAGQLVHDTLGSALARATVALARPSEASAK